MASAKDAYSAISDMLSIAEENLCSAIDEKRAIASDIIEEYNEMASDELRFAKATNNMLQARMHTVCPALANTNTHCKLMRYLYLQQLKRRLHDANELNKDQAIHINKVESDNAQLTRDLFDMFQALVLSKSKRVEKIDVSKPSKQCTHQLSLTPAQVQFDKATRAQFA
eukprot:5366-Heterococcus_DN1.PRE.1